MLRMRKQFKILCLQVLCCLLCSCVELTGEYFICRLTLEEGGGYHYSYSGTAIALEAVRDVLEAPDKQQDWDNALLQAKRELLEKARALSGAQVKKLEYSGKCRYEIEAEFSGTAQADASRHQGVMAGHFMDVQQVYVPDGPSRYTFTLFALDDGARSLLEKAGLARNSLLYITTDRPALAHNAARVREKGGQYLYFWSFEDFSAPAATITMAFTDN